MKTKLENAEEQKKEAARHAKLIDTMLEAHKRDLARKAKLEEEEKKALSEKVEQDLKDRMA